MREAFQPLREICVPPGGGGGGGVCGREEEGHEDPIKKNFSII